tara:strand:- start:4503 stop:5252 length:750 start_codon:yes stop_codon:yes gene_type:complete
MDPISLFKKTKFSNSIWWKLKTKVQGFRDEDGDILVTEILQNRCFRIVEKDLFLKNWEYKSRILIQLFEDGYLCWVNKDQLFVEQMNHYKRTQSACDEFYIQSQIPFILNWIKDQSALPNRYLWGGTFGPNYDCSGLIQTAFLKHDIFLPRDSYQMKNFCSPIFNFPGDINLLKMGDILFFGNKYRCNHVGIYIKNGYYYHSSGKDTGRNGIGKDNLIHANDLISLHYRSNLISAGRVTRSYQWNRSLR